MKSHYLHLDLKGIIPLYPRILDWLERFAACGYAGVVWEYEDRYPWASWPDTFRPGYTTEQWRTIWDRCHELGLETIPLIQTHGHLEWLLRDSEHSNLPFWRENGCWNEICPRNGEAVDGILRWVDEVCDLHKGCRYIHVGGDETWNLGTCPACRAVGDKMSVYLEHSRKIAEHVIKRGFKPVFWGDMFLRGSAGKPPDGAILVDWQYSGRGPWESTRRLKTVCGEVWGASATSAAYDLSNALSSIGDRLENVAAWKENADVDVVIHTTWGRSRSLLPLYGPWHNALPAILSGGANDRWTGSELQCVALEIDEVLSGKPTSAKELLAKVESLRPKDATMERLRRWWILGLRHRLLKCEFLARGSAFAQLEAVSRHLAVEPDYVKHSRRGGRAALSSLQEWQNDVLTFFKEESLGDAAEYVEGKANALRVLLGRDWSEGIVSEGEPVSTR